MQSRELAMLVNR